MYNVYKVKQLYAKKYKAYRKLTAGTESNAGRTVACALVWVRRGPTVYRGTAYRTNCPSGTPTVPDELSPRYGSVYARRNL